MAANWSKYNFFWDTPSVLTTERYLGCKQNLEEPVNDRFVACSPVVSIRDKACCRQLSVEVAKS